MKIRNKILTYISTTIILIMAVAFTFIYILFSEYREEEFQQQQNDKIKTTIKLLEEFKDESAEISYLLDEQDINDFYDEKLLIFDNDKNLLFESLDDLKIEQTHQILDELSAENNWIETKEGTYDLIGVYRERNGIKYLALSKAYDAYGHTKLDYLRNVLIFIFFLIFIIVILVSIYIAKTISTPITELESKINKFKIDKADNTPISIKTTTIELNSLTDRFNELFAHTNEVFRFQKHTIDHISHQLKTPISVLVSELEKIQSNSTEPAIKQQINQQKIKAKSLGEIINVLLEISKIESGQTIEMKKQRVDELIFDSIGELNIIYPSFNFNVNYSPNNMDADDLMIKMNPILLKQAFFNVLSNSVTYSQENHSEINLIVDNELKIQFSNIGSPITKEEEKFMFNYFFRGKNSDGKGGHGLGLMLTKQILKIHHGEISYNREGNLNVFEMRFL